MKTEILKPEPVEAKPQKLLWDIQEAAERLSMSVPSVRKLIRQGRLNPIPEFRHVRLSENELQRFAAAQ